MRRKIFLVALLSLVLVVGVVVMAPPPAVAMSGACERFVSNVVVGSYGSIWDAFACAASDPLAFIDIIGG